MNMGRLVMAGLLGTGTLSAAEGVVNGHRFTVPDGFTVELAAGTNLVQRPVSASFDDQGRLYVTDSSGSNEAPEKQLQNPDHRVLRLTDIDGDGIFDQSMVFADQVMFPQGCLWHGGSVYVAAPPSIWKFTDTDGDGVADQREEWFKGGTLTGCANDIHGPHLGPDGYLYWTKGAFSEQTHTLGNGRVLRDRAAHIYRARPDGSGLEAIMHGGMDNPVEIAFTPEGEALFTSTFIDFSEPGFRDGIAHAIYGGVYGKENDVLEDGRVKRTGPDLFHPFHQAGPAAECGLMRYEGAAWGAAFQDNVFATAFNLHKVTRHILRPEGATYASTDSDLLTADDPDFHPTDVLQDVAGDLLVVDTGGWYKLCCPSSQLAKPDVLGAIYRVRKLDGPTMTPEERKVRARKLADPPSLTQDSVVTELKREVWTLDPIHASRFRELVQTQGAEMGEAERAAALRVAAEGLGRLRDRAAVPGLLKAVSATSDSFLEHAYILALVEIAAPAETQAGLTRSEPRTQRAALIALDQMDDSPLKPHDVVPFLSAPNERLQGAAHWILGRHPEWGAELAGWFREQLSAPPAGSDGRSGRTDSAALLAQLRILTRDPAGQQFLADAIAQPVFSAATRIAALKAVADANLKQPPASWINAVRSALALHEEGGTELMPVAIRAARTASGDASVQKALLHVARERELPDPIRLDALAALPAGTALQPADFAFARSQLSSGHAPEVRLNAARLLARSPLTPGQLGRLTDDLRNAGPVELTQLIGAFDAGGDEVLGRQLIAALRESPSARALTPGQLQPHFAKFSESVRAEAAQFMAELDANVAQQAVHLESLLKELQAFEGDTRRGQAIFNSAQAACSSCHRIGYLGGDVGPELTRIGEVRSERDLLEALIYPSASFVRSYEPTTVVLEDGEEINGIVRRETETEITLVSGPGVEQRLPRNGVKEQRPGTVSIMPGGFDQALTRQELADLLMFVKTVRWR